MDRVELENAVFAGLPVRNETEANILKDALKLKPTEQLEDILRRMKEASSVSAAPLSEGGDKE